MPISQPNTYLQKHGLFAPQIPAPPAHDLGIIIVIPCCNEPNLTQTLDSLRACTKTPAPVEVIVVINAGEASPRGVKDQNLQTLAQLEQWQRKNIDERLKCFGLLFNDMPQKHAGVGLARKIGMDEAVARFESIGNNMGVILCLDADCTVAPDYLSAVYDRFYTDPDLKAAAIHFEHPLSGPEEDKVYQGIIAYELSLRYYRQGLVYAGYPFSFHTIGSSMAVRHTVYQSAGGMNRRKAGEDFYFLHKLMPLGGFGHITGTTVFPSPRSSDRVPFGTGRAISNWLAGKTGIKAYHWQTFEDLRALLDNRGLFYKMKHPKALEPRLPDSVNHFLEESGFEEKLSEMQRNSTSAGTFGKRWFQWFNGFRVLKYVHFCRDNYYPLTDLEPAANYLLKKSSEGTTSGISLLEAYRKLDKRAEMPGGASGII